MRVSLSGLISSMKRRHHSEVWRHLAKIKSAMAEPNTTSAALHRARLDTVARNLASLAFPTYRYERNRYKPKEKNNLHPN